MEQEIKPRPTQREVSRRSALKYALSLAGTLLLSQVGCAPGEPRRQATRIKPTPSPLATATIEAAKNRLSRLITPTPTPTVVNMLALAAVAANLEKPSTFEELKKRNPGVRTVDIANPDTAFIRRDKGEGYPIDPASFDRFVQENDLFDKANKAERPNQEVDLAYEFVAAESYAKLPETLVIEANKYYRRGQKTLAERILLHAVGIQKDLIWVERYGIVNRITNYRQGGPASTLIGEAAFRLTKGPTAMKATIPQINIEDEGRPFFVYIQREVKRTEAKRSFSAKFASILGLDNPDDGKVGEGMVNCANKNLCPEPTLPKLTATSTSTARVPATPTPSRTPTATETSTPIPTAPPEQEQPEQPKEDTATPTVLPLETPTPAPTNVHTAIPTPTRGPEGTPTPPATVLPLRTPTPAPTNVHTAIPTPTRGAERTPTPAPTNVHIIPTPTRGPEKTPTQGQNATPTRGPEATPTSKPVATPTRGVEVQATPTRGAENKQVATVLPVTPTAVKPR